MTMVNFRPKFIVGCKAQFAGRGCRHALGRRQKVRAGSTATGLGDRSWMQVALCALWLSQPFITEPWIRAQRMERKIVRSPRKLDFMNVDRVAAVLHQDLLS